MMQTKIVIRVVDFDAARSVAGYLSEALVPAPLAVTSFEDGPTAHKVEAYFDAAPDLAALDHAMADLGVTGISPAVSEAVPDANWVSISQAALPPVIAGRFIVHGSHDAEKVGAARGAILIDAGEAFGTAHHATTLGCLLAIDRLARQHTFSRVLDLGCGTGARHRRCARDAARARDRQRHRSHCNWCCGWKCACQWSWSAPPLGYRHRS
jgi:ribosomal protein L11 methyltransferase